MTAVSSKVRQNIINQVYSILLFHFIFDSQTLENFLLFSALQNGHDVTESYTCGCRAI